MFSKQTAESCIFLLQTKALPAEHIDISAISPIAVHQSMIHHRRMVLPGFATVSFASFSVMLAATDLLTCLGRMTGSDFPEDSSTTLSTCGLRCHVQYCIMFTCRVQYGIVNRSPVFGSQC